MDICRTLLQQMTPHGILASVEATSKFPEKQFRNTFFSSFYDTDSAEHYFSYLFQKTHIKSHDYPA